MINVFLATVAAILAALCLVGIVATGSLVFWVLLVANVLSLAANLRMIALDR